MKSGRVIALVVGCLMLLPGLGLLLGGGGLGLAYAFGRDDAGYFALPLTAVESPTVAITAKNFVLTTDLPTSAWLPEALETDFRLRVTPTGSDSKIFLGIGPAAAVRPYLAGAPNAEITGIAKGGTPVYQTSPGFGRVEPPAAQTFWTTTATGVGTQELNWHAVDGRWTVAIMNPDGSEGISATASVQVRAGFLLPLALILLGFGLLVTAGAVFLIVVGASRSAANRSGDKPWPPDNDLAAVGHGAADAPTIDRPVVLTARIDPVLSRWQWLVKWFLAIPHFLVLSFLWPAFLVVTLIAGFSILFTGVYPRVLFDFNCGVLRWSWRVSFYAFSGGIGTDQYPPFSLGSAPGYPAALDIAYPTQLSRGLVLVKWWLLAIPHYLIIGLMVGNWFAWTSAGNDRFAIGPVGGAGVLGLLIAIAGTVLLFTGKYPRPLFNLIVGMNRWIYRVVVYAALMTDQYPPFRLDQGGSEPTPAPQFPTLGPADPRVPEPTGTRNGP